MALAAALSIGVGMGTVARRLEGRRRWGEGASTADDRDDRDDRQATNAIHRTSVATTTASGDRHRHHPTIAAAAAHRRGLFPARQLQVAGRPRRRRLTLLSLLKGLVTITGANAAAVEADASIAATRTRTRMV